MNLFTAFPDAWLRDARVRMCSVSTRGMLLDILAAIADGETGHLTATKHALSRLCGCTETEVVTALSQMQLHHVFSFCNGIENDPVTVTHNGLVTLFENRRKSRERTEKYRAKMKASNPVTEAVTQPVTQPVTVPKTKSHDNGNAVVTPEIVVADAGLERLRLMVCKWYRRRPTTKWTEKELKALKAVHKLATPDDDLARLDAYYTRDLPPGKDYRRRDVVTLLNNWNGEIDRASGEPLETPPDTHGLRRLLSNIEEHIRKHPGNRASVFHDSTKPEAPEEFQALLKRRDEILEQLA